MRNRRDRDVHEQPDTSPNILRAIQSGVRKVRGRQSETSSSWRPLPPAVRARGRRGPSRWQAADLWLGRAPLTPAKAAHPDTGGVFLLWRALSVGSLPHRLRGASTTNIDPGLV